MPTWPNTAVCLLLLLATAAGVRAGAAWAQDSDAAATDTRAGAPPSGRSGLPVPRFVSLRAPKVNMRTGPGVRYPIDWVYSRSGLPLEVVDEFETWRRVRDWEGSLGWMHQSMLSGERTAMIVDKQRLLRREPEAGASGLALVEAGVIGRLTGCDGAWCRIEIKGFDGWLRRDEIFGADPGDAMR